MATSLPSITPLQPVDPLTQQNIDSLQDALQDYTQAQNDGVPGAAAKVSAAQAALNAFGVQPATSAATSASTIAPVSSSTNLNASPASNSTTLGSVVSSLVSAYQGGTSGGLSRAILLILGIILFAAGLFSFKQAQTVIDTGTSVVKKGAGVVKAIAATP